MAKLLITNRMENLALLKSARMVHRRWEMARCSIAIMVAIMTEIPIKEILRLKYSEIDSKMGLDKKWDNISPEAFALILGAKEWKIEGSEYVFPDRFGNVFTDEKFEATREAIEYDSGLSDIIKPGSFVMQ